MERRLGTWARMPLPRWLIDYKPAWLRDDLAAGATAAAVIVPIAMAHATIAGLPVLAGLATVIFPTLAYALLGTSRVLSVSTTSTIAVLVASAWSEVAAQSSPGQAAGIASTLALLAGAMLVLASVARLGFVANFISGPVLVGFKAGIGLVIVLDQVPKLLGVHIEKTGFFRDAAAVAAQVPELSAPTLVIGMSVMAIVFAGRRWWPAGPAPLAAIVLASLAVALLGLRDAGVDTVGAIQGGIAAPSLPRLDHAGELWLAAAGIALMSFAESIAAGRAFTPPGETRPASNRELAATGAGCLVGSFFGAMPCGGGTTQTAVNLSAGARTQCAALTTAAITVAAIAFLGSAIAYMPRAALAAVVIAYSIGLVNLGEFRAIRAVRTTEFRWAVIAFSGVLVLGTLRGILVAVIASLLTLLHQANNPPVHELRRKRGTQIFRARSPDHPGDEAWPGLLVVRPEGRLFFANAERVGDKMWALFQQAAPGIVVIDMSGATDLEYTALTMLSAGEERLAREGAQLWLAGLNPQVLGIVRQTPLGRKLGAERMFRSVQEAVEVFERDGPAATPQAA